MGSTLPSSVSTILNPHGWGRRKKFEKRLSDGWKMPSWDWLLQIQYFIRAPFY